MFEQKTEAEAREEILTMVTEYCKTFHMTKKEYQEGDRISYASRVYDEAEMWNLADSALEFWLTSGRYTERSISAYLTVLSLIPARPRICLRLWLLRLRY